MGALRFLLAYSVMVFHVQPRTHARLNLLDGGIAVLVFFLISGFFMSMVYSRKYARLPEGQARFYLNRFLRIFPLYLVAMLFQQAEFSLDRMPTVFTNDMGYTALTRATLIAMNFLKLGQDLWQTLGEAFRVAHRSHSVSLFEPLLTQVFGPSAFVIRPGTFLVGQGWSLATELVYYLLVPFLLARRWTWLAAFGLLSLATRFAFLLGLGADSMGSWRLKFFPCVFIYFLLGHLSFRIHERCEGWHLRARAEGVSLALWTALLAYGFARGGLLADQEYDGPLVWLFFCFVTVTVPFVFSATQHSRVDSFLGEFSYPIYLLHPILIQFDFLHLRASDTGHYLNLLMGILVLSLLLIFGVERPLNRLRARVARG